MKKVTLLMIAPLPPPYAGPEVATKILLDNGLENFFRLHFIKSNIRKKNRDKGKFDFRGFVTFIAIYMKAVIRIIFYRTNPVYILLSQNRIGLLRDIVYIITFRLFNCKIIAHLHGSNFLNFYQSRSSLYKHIIRKSLNRLSALIVQSNLIVPQFENLIPLNRIYVLGNCINDHHIKPKKESQKAINENRIILYVGYLTYAKGYYDLLYTIPSIIDKNPEVEFWFVGEEFNKERNIVLNKKNVDKEKIINIKKKYFNHIKFYGSISNDQLNELMNEADLFVLPSYSEGFPMSILEAMAHGLPIVATNVGAVPDIIQNGNNGFLCEPGDIHKLSENLLKILRNDKLYETMSLNNIMDVKNNYTAEKIVPQFVEIVNSVHQDK